MRYPTGARAPRPSIRKKALPDARARRGISRTHTNPGRTRPGRWRRRGPARARALAPADALCGAGRSTGGRGRGASGRSI